MRQLFTGRVEWELTGKHLVEDNFLENYCLPETFACLPEGMVPMCYPSDTFQRQLYRQLGVVADPGAV